MHIIYGMYQFYFCMMKTCAKWWSGDTKYLLTNCFPKVHEYVTIVSSQTQEPILQLQHRLIFQEWSLRLLHHASLKALLQLRLDKMNGRSLRTGVSLKISSSCQTGSHHWYFHKWFNTLSPIIMVQWNITLNERKLILEGPTPFPLHHDYGRKGSPFPLKRGKRTGEPNPPHPTPFPQSVVGIGWNMNTPEN